MIKKIKLVLSILFVIFSIGFTSSSASKFSKEVLQKYSGSWMNKDSFKDDVPYGIGADIKIDKNNNIQGTISDSSYGFVHVAGIDIKGKIINNIFKSNFEDDGWGNGGTLELEFKDNIMMLIINYVGKNSQGQADWGISTGSFKLVNTNSSISRTVSDLKDGQWEPVPNQCFDITLNSYKNVKFLAETNFNVGFKFYLADKKGNIVCKFPDYYQSSGVLIDSIKAISFKDIDNDGLKDVIILYNGSTIKDDTSVSVCNILLQKSDKSFKNDKIADTLINNSSNNKDIASVVKYYKTIVKQKHNL
jgi:hypothetical protein